MISDAVSMIHNMTQQTAAALELQSRTSEEINRNIVIIQNRSEKTAKASRATAETSALWCKKIGATRGIVRQFSS